MNWTVLKSIFKRDFVSYFSSPTGYVFICVFVVLSSLATFWPPEFFTSNLANLDQLSRWLPFIMLVFIPAITMGTWAEERRQGTDELLLTVPATDLDVVLGKYLAGVAIFTVSLMFSAFSIFLVFKWGLGNPDLGLFLSTYFGYWFIGLTMIAIGMVASFLTDNLTVSFILGMVFNMPLALFGVADWFVSNPAYAQTVRQWSALEQFRDFERGVISLGGMTYFIAIAIVMIYISMVLIGRRHWQAREEGSSLGWHFLVRTIALLLLAIGVTQIVQSRNSLRVDISNEQLSTLSDDTLKIIREIREDDDSKPVKIEVFVSPQVPTDYVEKKNNLLATLAEFKALSGGKIQYVINEIETFGEGANRAEDTYGITPRLVATTAGANDEIFLGIGITSGLGKVVIPFLGKGIPVEYELIRSIATVKQQKNLRLGILDTGIPSLTPSSNREQEWPLLTELRKQYDIEDRPIDPSQPINTEKFDVLLAIQPSMLGPQELDHFVDAIRAGVPTAILEDPAPVGYAREGTVGTASPKRPQGMMAMFGGGQPEPKGDINQLWKTLDILMDPAEATWQDYKPDSTIRTEADPQWIFVDSGNGTQEPLNSDNVITSGLNQLLFLYAGSMKQEKESKLSFQQLAVTGGTNSGKINLAMLQQSRQMRQEPYYQKTKKSYILAAQIEGLYIEPNLLLDESLSLEAAAAKEADEANSETTAEQTDLDVEDVTDVENLTVDGEKPMNVVLVADIDWIIPAFFMIRESGDGQIIPATQNVTFILNIIDSLADDDRFIEIRKRVRKHRTLSKIDEATKKYRVIASELEKKSDEEIKAEEEEAQTGYQEKIDAVNKIQGLSSIEREQRKQRVGLLERERLEENRKSIETRRKRRRRQIKHDLEQEVRSVQDLYKMYAILVPPIPPLLVALFVFFRRRESEREGIIKSRRR